MHTISETVLLNSNRVFAAVGDYSKLHSISIKKYFANARYILVCFRGISDLPLCNAFALFSSIDNSPQIVLLINSAEATEYPVVVQSSLDSLIEQADYVLDLNWAGRDLPIAAAQYSSTTFALGTEMCSTITPPLQAMGYTGNIILLH